MLALPAAAAAADVDFNAPLFIKAGTAICTTSEELDVFLSGAPARCRRVTADTRAWLLERRGWLAPNLRVRMGSGDRITEGWLLGDGLRN